MFLPLSVIEHGPSSNKRPVDELHPGPPFSHIVSGVSLGDVRDSKNLRKFNVSPTLVRNQSGIRTRRRDVCRQRCRDILSIASRMGRKA